MKNSLRFFENRSRLLSLVIELILIQFVAVATVLAQSECPEPPDTLVEDSISEVGNDPAVAIDACGSFVIVWDQFVDDRNARDMLVRQYDPYGDPVGSDAYVSSDQSGCCSVNHFDASIAMSANGLVRVGWIVECQGCGHDARGIPTELESVFYHGTTPPQAGMPPPETPAATQFHYAPSVGVSDLNAGLSTWINSDGAGPGIVVGVDFETWDVLRACDPHCRIEQWQPCMATRGSDGAYAIAWAEAESSDELPSFNIAIRVYDSTGELIAERVGDNDEWVNQPEFEPNLSSQISPAVDLDNYGNVIVVWFGERLNGCPGDNPYVYARRFKLDLGQGALRDPDPEAGEGRAGMFAVNETTNPSVLISWDFANPTVALKQHPGQLDLGIDQGSFVVAWNVEVGGIAAEVHGRYFTSEGHARGTEVRLNDGSGQDNRAQLPRSAAHALAYGPDHQAVVVWNEGVLDPPYYPSAKFTLRPGPDWIRAIPDCLICQTNPGICFPCYRADVDGNCAINGLDIQPFVDLCLGDIRCLDSGEFCRADMQQDGDVDLDDIPCFVQALLTGQSDCQVGPDPRSFADCNENEVPDANDIADGTSQDCNGNFIPDECDLASETSVDADENGVPDECQPDCNGNDVPDEKDIADEESLDCNANGIPDECEQDCNSNGVPDECDLDPEDPDGDEWVSADCNGNGVPDECEDDCNENGVPDDCDVDPLDPDGDEWVSPDCNENGYPDECDLSLPPGMGSYDCNENEVPDECDIADETSCDANENGVPDECDILMEECVDANEDDCCDEEESLMGGGESSQSSESESSSPCDELTESECWAVYYDWAMQQCWGPPCEASGFEQYQAARAKLAELGLPF